MKIGTNLLPPGLLLTACLTTCMALSAFSTYALFPVKYVRYLNSSCNVVASAVLILLGLEESGTPFPFLPVDEVARFTEGYGRPLAVSSNAVNSRSPRSTARDK